METNLCNHPDHRDTEDCQDRAVACRPDCPCCLCPTAIAYYAAEKARREKQYVVVTRRGTLADYRWEASEPMSLEAADALVAEHEAKGWLSKRWTAQAVETAGLPEGWIYGKSDAACIRERLSEIEQDRYSVDDGYALKGWSLSDVREATERLDAEESLLRKKLAELEATEP